MENFYPLPHSPEGCSSQPKARSLELFGSPTGLRDPMWDIFSCIRGGLAGSYSLPRV